ncbi:MAG: glycosyltransferase [Candidatus Zixiibacteriota bacterium]
MRILFANTLHFRHGGPSVHTFDLVELLRNAGHSAEIFSMKHERNLESEIAEYFPSKIDYPALLEEGGLKNSLKVLSRTFYSRESQKNFEALLDHYKPDIVHLQNYLHHLTPSIIRPARKRGIPVFWTLHDSVLVCPNTNLFNDRLHGPCTKCDSTFKRLINPIINKCKKDSRAASFIASLEALSFQIIGLEKMIDFFISPSKFLIGQLNKMGFQRRNIYYIPNFSNFPSKDTPIGDYVLYFGRIENAKGIFDLIEAVESIQNDISLIIAGGGSKQGEIIESDRIHYIGHLGKDELIDAISNSRFTVMPSICYENAPLTVAESMLLSKPVIGSDIGGIPELISHGETGYIFEPGNTKELSGYIKKLWNSPNLVKRMGKRGRTIASVRHSPQKYLNELMKLYKNSREK